jgi:YfiR/HmsC-like
MSTAGFATALRGPRKRLRRALAAATFVAATALTSADAAAQTVASPEEIEAAYVHKFLSYVDWPPKVFSSADAPIVVGVAGSDRMFELVSGVAANRPVQGRPVQVRRLGNPGESADVHLVFVGREAWKDLPAWAAWSKENPVVLTTDAPQGIERGAALAFVQTGQRIRFEASLPVAEMSGVKLSARLLAVAERVVGAGQ